jgi:hypothetical protein
VTPGTTIDPLAPVRGGFEAGLEVVEAPAANVPGEDWPAARSFRTDDWPRTKRPLPWMIAAFLAMVWLIPFDTISLSASLPFDLHLDRIVLPFIVLAWGLAIAIGGAMAPRLKLTPIHSAIGAFVLVGFASVVLNAGSLNQSLELNNAIKQLLLLSAYVSFFILMASTVRLTEVQAFLKYSLLLAVVCGIGTLVEFRFHYNPFYDLSAKLLPGFLHVLPAADTGRDEIGRVVIDGPAELSLEVAAMMALAVPLALVGLMHAPRRRAQLGYGIASCVVLAAGLATYRKTSLVAPAIIFILLVALRPRRVGRLVPLLVVMFVGAHVLAPGAVGSVLQQFSGSRLSSVSTTSHRTDGYDAIRPLVWAHPAFGQGLGSYTNLDRILDNQLLDTVIEMGLIGLATYVAMVLVVVKVALPMIRGPGGERSQTALAVALGAVGFLVLSGLFDEMSFPHAPYIFLSYAALLAVLVANPEARRPALPGPSRGAR